MLDAQTEWALLLLTSLREAGVSEVVISPGSRSTPLVWAATQTSGLRCHRIIDERSAAFHALGQARVSGFPTLLLCTSGSAASHYYPAVIEARESSIPLLVLSADRPFELMHSGAHQTIDQTRLFGNYASYYELGTPVLDRGALLGLRRTARQAVEAALGPPRGAVHLNFRARKPLEPQPSEARLALPDLRLLEPSARRSLAPSREELAWVLDALSRSDCPLLLCGASAAVDGVSATLIRRFTQLSGAIVCPEVVSQLRLQLDDAAMAPGLLCDTYDWLLGSESLASSLAPDFVLQLGATPVSAALGRMLEQTPGLTLGICAESGWPDALHKSAQVLRCRAGDLIALACEALEARPASARVRKKVEGWRSAQALARAVVDREARTQFDEPAAVQTLLDRLPRDSWLVLGNSLAPRLIDRYCGARARGISICSQRGASGIEGAVAGALGAATVTARTTTLLVGDISFLHDISSLWAADGARSGAGPWRHPVVLVVLNNQGGRIFEQLPIAERPDVALEWWTTPHDLALEHAAALYGLPFARATSHDTLEAVLETAYARAGVSVIEIRVAPDSAKHRLAEVQHEIEPRFGALAGPAGAA